MGRENHPHHWSLYPPDHGNPRDLEENQEQTGE